MQVTPSILRYAAAGVLAAAAGMAVGHLAATVVEPAASPVTAIGAVVVDATPTPVKEWAVATLGTADKPILIATVVLVTVVLSAGIGLLARRWRTAGLVLLVVLVTLAGLAAVGRPSAGQLAVVPSLLAGLTGVIALTWLCRLADLESEPAGSGRPESPLDHTAYAIARPGRPGRRSFVTAAAGTGIGALTVGGVASLASGRTSAVAAQPLPSPSAPAAPLPPGLETTTRGISALRTPRDEFYRIDTALTIPRVDVSSWTLTIDGMVDHKVVVTWAELLAMDLIERDVTINCVSNEVGGPYIGATRWTGVPVRNILQRAGIRAEADQILSTSVDGMTISTPVEALLDDREALLVVGMDGATLPPEHGFPVRLITPGLYGFVGATKWLSRLTATTYAAQPAYWTERGWAIDAPVQPQARIDVPGRGNSTSAGTVAIGGVAWAMATGGITAVQVRVDDGPWQQARLGPEVGARYWRQWVLPWEARRGRHTITARAVDASGEPQVEAERDPYPSGATGWHSIEVNIT